MSNTPKISNFAGRKTLSVMLTFACPAECHDCGTISSPRDRHNLALDLVLRGIEEAKRLDFENVVFTGGEATLRWDDLLTAIAYADGLGLPTRLVTNAHWATSFEEASLKLDALLDAGLGEINFSTGDEHVRFIPLEYVIWAVLATVQRELVAYVMVELRSSRQVTKQQLLNHPLIQPLTESQKKLIQPTESPWMPLHPQRIESYPDGIAVNESNLSNCLGCDSVLQTYVMQADGRIGACCGLGMRVINELNVKRAEGNSFLEDAIIDSEEDFLKVWLHYKGPEKILAWASQHDSTIQWANMYGHRCQACIRLYRDPKVQQVLREHYEEAIPDLLQTIWLRDYYIPNKLAI